MKKLICTIVVLFALAFLYSYAKGQDIDAEAQAKPATTVRDSQQWKLTWEKSLDSSLETRNLVPLAERVAITNATRFTTEFKGRTVWLESKLGRSSGPNDYNYLVGFSGGIQKKAGEFDIIFEAQANYSRYFNYGSVGGEVGRRFHSENFSVKPFSRLDYYFPIDNFGNTLTRQPISNGLVWSNGITTKHHRKRLSLANEVQIILDTGGIHAGKRTLLNTELEFGLNYGRFCFGPKFGFTHRVSGIGLGHKRNHFQGGFFVRYQ